MTERGIQLDAFATPGTVLRSAREKQGLTAREAADRLNLMPDYVDILERDDYESLRSPPFARGYVKAYGRLLSLDEQHLLALFDEMGPQQPARRKARIETPPLQLQRTGLGVVIGLGVLLLLVAGLWWWGQDRAGHTVPGAGSESSPQSGNAMQLVGGEG